MSLTFTTDKPLIPYFAGGACVAFLYGVTTGQAAFYWSRSGKDKKVLRMVVMLLWQVAYRRCCAILTKADRSVTLRILDSAHSVLVPCSFYILLAETFHEGNQQIRIQAFTSALQLWSYQAVFVVTGFTDLVIKSIYTYRIWKRNAPALEVGLYGVPDNFAVSNNKLLVALLSSFALTAFVLSWAPVFLGNCVVSAGSLVTFVLVGDNSAAFVSTFWVVPKFSINSLLALLNARRRLREGAVSFVASSMTADLPPIDESLHPEEPHAGRRVRQARRFIVTMKAEVELDGDHAIEMAPVGAQATSESLSRTKLNVTAYRPSVM
ncbi:hypothetical protein FOMPIDRAFT_88369 [Fomitopsis schrenkii]|uniref:Uncharacterized protein n=1 Tax=Fomitopsis schrenkii TaxID=2126942 RepID=S8E5R6_FOMSC|nr:hypothetical protein FOMPIDRAFT_88369 [Fomitopsis schrenkii]